MRSIAILNGKGGTGKTVTAVNLGTSLARLGARVLLVDMDPQADLTMHLNLRGSRPNMADFLLNGVGPSDVIRRSLIDNLDVLPAGTDLSHAEMQLVTEFGREGRFRRKMGSYGTDRYEFVLIDCPPSLGLLTVNVLCFCDEVLVPVNCEFFSLQGLSRVTETLNRIGEQLDHQVKLAGILLTFYDPRRLLCRKAETELGRTFGELLFRTKIRSNVAIAHSTERTLDVATYEPESHGAEDYRALAQEILTRGGVPSP